MIWFYWGNPRMSFLRFMSIWSAHTLGQAVALVVPRSPEGRKGDWDEDGQDMDSQVTLDYSQWIKRLPYGTVFELERICPEVAEIGAPEIQTSDLLGWYLLWKYGGTISDMDIVFTKRVPSIEEEVKFVRFDGYPRAGYTPVSFLQGRSCRWWGEVYREALRTYNPDVYESCGAHLLESAILPESYSRLPSRIVFPWADGKDPWIEWSRLTFEETHRLPPECIGIHWYAGSSGGRRWNVNLNHSTLKEYPSTMTEAISVTYQGRN